MKTNETTIMPIGAFRNLIGEDEKTVGFRIMDESGHDLGRVYEFICPKEMDKRGDVLAAIEETLHTMLDEGFDDESIRFYLGAVKKRVWTKNWKPVLLSTLAIFFQVCLMTTILIETFFERNSMKNLSSSGWLTMVTQSKN